MAQWQLRHEIDAVGDLVIGEVLVQELLQRFTAGVARLNDYFGLGRKARREPA